MTTHARGTTWQVLLLAGGVCALQVALRAPLVRFPVVGSLQFAQSSLGSPRAAWLILAALAVAACLLLSRKHCLAITGLLMAAGTLGFLAGTLNGLYQGSMERVQMLVEAGGDAGIEQVLAGMQYQWGAFLLVAGSSLYLAGAAWAAGPTHAIKPIP